MRFGLVGTGNWARVCQGAGLQAAPDAELVGVWGRSTEKAGALATDLGATAYTDYDAMLADVDAVAFSVPPDVQAAMAFRAAEAGKHLLLEKPIATATASAALLADAVAANNLASAVFFTHRFDAAQRAWIADIASRDDWEGARGLWLNAAFAPGSPFDTPWRHEKGGLWDVGPHALSMLIGGLGPVTDLVARGGRGDLVHLLTRHESGATATVSVCADTSPDAAHQTLVFWGPGGERTMPVQAPSVEALATAAGELIASAAQAQPSHPCDVQFGRQVVELLAQAQEQVDASR
jgi:predicted dehydrogenase